MNIDSNIGTGIAILFAKSIDIVLAIHFQVSIGIGIDNTF